MNDDNNNGGQVTEPLETAQWTNYLPESFGIRKSVQESSYRWCARESGMWGIATGSAITFHRLRMKSTVNMSINVGFATTLIVFYPSYYFCVKRRKHREKMIELMMKMNTFDHAKRMPEEVPIDQHPFVKPVSQNESEEEALDFKEYRTYIPEKKEWQQPDKSKDMKDVFKESK